VLIYFPETNKRQIHGGKAARARLTAPHTLSFSLCPSLLSYCFAAYSFLFRMALPAALILAVETVLNSFITAAIIGNTDKGSWIRLPVVLAVAYLGYLEVLTAMDFSPSLLYNGTLAAACCVKCIHLVNLL
jgi:hypothetical protein